MVVGDFLLHLCSWHGIYVLDITKGDEESLPCFPLRSLQLYLLCGSVISFDLTVPREGRWEHHGHSLASGCPAFAAFIELAPYLSRLSQVTF